MKISKNIIDMFIRLKNSSKNYKKYSLVLKTKENIKLLNFLYKERFIGSYIFNPNSNYIKVGLRYKNNTPLIQNIKFISKTKKEFYCSIKILSKHKLNNELIIILTPKGYMNINDALNFNLGGQIICTIN